MAVTTKKLFPATSNATTTVFSPVGIQLNNQDDLDVYVTLSGGTRVLQLRQSTGSTAQSSHPQVNNTDGLYFPAVTAGTTLYNYTLSTDNNTITFNSALPQGAVVFCERRTRDADSTYTTFASGSTIRATDLNNSSTESNFTAQDGRNKALTIEGALFNGDQPSTNFVTSSHIVDGTIQTTDIGADQITGALIADDTINSEHYADLSVDTEHIANVNITTAKLANDAVTSAKLADNAVLTANITDSNVTTAKIAADAITGAKIADSEIDSEHIVHGSIDTVHLASAAVTGGKIADSTIATQKLADSAITTAKINNGAVTSTKLDPSAVITESEQAASTPNDTSFFTTAAAEARYFNASTGETIKDGDTFPDNDTTIATTAAINDRIIDLVDDVGGFVPIANETSFPTANPDVNNGSGTLVSIKSIGSTRTPSSGTVTIANGAGSGNTVTITGCGSTVLTAGFGVIVETTSTLHTYAFHRLVPKATEVTTVAGISGNVTTVAGIAANTTTVAGISSDVTTVAGIASNVTSVANNTSNINSAVSNASNINSAVSNASNINTVAGSISNVNSVSGSIANVNTTASNLANVNNFAATYQIASSDPSTDGAGNALAAGDLYFNTSSNELRVHNGSTFQGGVTATGNLAGLGANTFTGNQSHGDNVKSIFGTGNDLEIYHSGSHSIINDAGTGNLHLQLNGTSKFNINSTGAHIAGNLTVNGNVDGRDVAADGTKLDGIEANAINASNTAITNKLPLAGGTLTGDLGITKNNPTITLTDNDNNPDYQIGNINGVLRFQDTTNNASRLSIGTNGKIGIGTTTPNRLLHITSNGESKIALTDADITAETNSLVGGIDFTTTDTDNAGTSAHIGAYHQDDQGSAYLRFDTGTGGSATERMRITSDGAVNITSGGSSSTVPSIGVTNNLTGAFIQTFQGLTPNMASGNKNILILGRSRSSKNAAFLAYRYSGTSSSNDNLFTISHWGSNDLLTINGEGNTTIVGNLAVDTDTLFVNKANDRVGINTASPSYELDLVGTQRTTVSAADTQILNLTANMGISNNRALIIKSPLNDSGVAPFRIQTGNALEVQIDGNKTLNIDSSGQINLHHAGSATAKLFTDSAGIGINGNITVTGTVDGVDVATRDTLFGGLTSSSGVLTNGVTATTQSQGDNSTKVATTAYVDALTVATNLAQGRGNATYTITSSTGNDTTILAATTSLAGIMTAADKTKLDTYEANSSSYLRSDANDTMAATLTVQKVIPSTDSQFDIGENGTRFANGYFDTLYGDGSNLTGISAGAQGGGSDEVFWCNGQSVTSDFTIPNGKNAMSAGPITINSGVTVTVGAGETWTVV